jgi:hypothetical protein
MSTDPTMPRQPTIPTFFIRLILSATQLQVCNLKIETYCIAAFLKKSQGQIKKSSNHHITGLPSNANFEEFILVHFQILKLIRKASETFQGQTLLSTPST